MVTELLDTITHGRQVLNLNPPDTPRASTLPRRILLCFSGQLAVPFVPGSTLNFYFSSSLLSIYSQQDLTPSEPPLGKPLNLSAPSLQMACISPYPFLLLSWNNRRGVPPFIPPLMLSIPCLQPHQESYPIHHPASSLCCTNLSSLLHSSHEHMKMKTFPFFPDLLLTSLSPSQDITLAQFPFLYSKTCKSCLRLLSLFCHLSLLPHPSANR